MSRPRLPTFRRRPVPSFYLFCVTAKRVHVDVYRSAISSLLFSLPLSSCFFCLLNEERCATRRPRLPASERSSELLNAPGDMRQSDPRRGWERGIRGTQLRVRSKPSTEKIRSCTRPKAPTVGATEMRMCRAAPSGQPTSTPRRSARASNSRSMLRQRNSACPQRSATASQPA
jgi:hypothetical protein